MDNSYIKRIIITWMAHNCLTLTQVAQKIGIHKGNLSRIFNFKTPMTKETIDKIVNVFPDFPKDFILGYLKEN